MAECVIDFESCLSEVLSKLNDTGMAFSLKKVQGSEASSDKDIHVKVLGMNWNTHDDEFLFSFHELIKLANSLRVTKRTVLKVTAKIYDPLRFLSPLTVGLKILFQTLCIDKADWDSELKGESLQQWKLFLQELKQIDSYRLPCCYFVGQPVDVQLHGFSNASKRAYDAAVYARSTYIDGHVTVRLVASKSIVAPIKKQTIPRLELLGALILARFVNKLKSNSIEYPTVLWTDSSTVLCWIKNEKGRVWKQYVGQRVDQLCRLTPKESWRHCPGELNPADLPSRGLTARELSNSNNWWNGPTYLYGPAEEWPKMSQAHYTEDEEVLQEVIKNESTVKLTR